MRKEQLTVVEALKFARHDFLNELQLVLMHIDFGDVAKAKQAIVNTTEEMRQASMLQTLGLPETEKWLLTFDWVYTAFRKKLSCTIENGDRKADDAKVVAYLERIFQEVEAVLDPVFEYEVSFDVEASSSDWSVRITINGPLDGKTRIPEVTTEDFFVEEMISHNLWTFTLSGR